MNCNPEVMEKIVPIAEEMGEKRFKQYMKVYLELGQDKRFFFDKFAEYLDSCKEDKNGYKKISTFNFKSFILGVPSIEELQEIWENIEDPLDEFFDC